MKRFIFIQTILLILTTISANAQKASATTSHSKGTFTSTVKIKGEVTNEAVQATINTFFNQYKNNLNGLFEWALKDLKLQGEADDLIVFNIKSHTLNNNMVNGVMDIIISPINKKYNNVKYNVSLNLKKTKDTPQIIELTYNMTDCEEVIKSASAVLTVTQSDAGTATCTLTANVQLTRFYNPMMSTKMYKEHIEWRFTKLVENLYADALRRSK